MPYKDPQKRREYARRFYSSPEQKAKKREYDHARYERLKPQTRERNSRWLYPHRFAYDGEWVCAECGSTDRPVIHHRDHDHSNNDPENLMCLCRSCHARLHIEERDRNAQGQVIAARAVQ